MNPGKVGIYVCGPTVYNYIHVGNARPMIVFDTLRRFLIHLGYQVTYVSNYTDIDDKMIRRAAEEHTTVAQIAEKYIAEYETDSKALNVLPPDVKPRATRHIPEIIALIQKLFANGLAYAAGGDVYFDTQAYRAHYGQLIGQDLDDLESGARGGGRRQAPSHGFRALEGREARRARVGFALGRGRPGWHVECSAMSMKYLGETFDIHAVGST